MNQQIRIVIADDHSMIRECLKQLLELDGDIVVVGEAGGGCNEKGKRGREELQKGTGNFWG